MAIETSTRGGFVAVVSNEHSGLLLDVWAIVSIKMAGFPAQVVSDRYYESAASALTAAFERAPKSHRLAMDRADPERLRRREK